jgi:uncharacterized membrane protein YesL
VNWLGKLNSIEKYFLSTYHSSFVMGAGDGCWFALASYVLLFAASNGPVAVGTNYNGL